MNKITWLLPVALIMVYCCNSVKRVNKDPAKQMQVVNTWLAANPLHPDTSYIFKTGTTVSYDTIYTNPDSTGGYGSEIHQNSNPGWSMTEPPKGWVKTVTKTIHIHDTVQITTKDVRLINALQDAVHRKDSAIEAQIIGRKKEEIRADVWRLKFWTLAGIAIFIISIPIALKWFRIL